MEGSTTVGIVVSAQIPSMAPAQPIPQLLEHWLLTSHNCPFYRGLPCTDQDLFVLGSYSPVPGNDSLN